MNVVLMEGEEQQAQVALNTPMSGGTQTISWAQEAQTMRSFLIRKSALSCWVHLHASFPMVPWTAAGNSAVVCDVDD